MNRIQLSKVVSHALRHEPWVYELELDDQGWVDVDSLIEALGQMRAGWQSLTAADLESMIAKSDKVRHELENGRIRAKYGHSVPNRINYDPAIPPQRLYHGTFRAAMDAIKSAGLRPMNRQYVHLSPDVETATSVGKRKDDQPIILSVHARDAHHCGIQFFKGNDHVWLAESVPAEFIGFDDWTCGG